jgi:hypothetical protein
MSTPRLLAVVAVLALAAACSSKDKSRQSISDLAQKLGAKQDSVSQGSGDESNGRDPCSLLDSSEVAAAIGPLASPPYRGSFEPNANAETCRYDTKDHRRILVSVDWDGGAAAMKIVGFGRKLTDPIAKQGVEQTGVTVLSTGDTLKGSWDQVAQGPMQCGDYHALRGDRHVELDWTGTRLTPQTAAALLDSAVKQLDHPLPINGAAGVPAAKLIFAAEAKDTTLVMCDLIPQSKAEAALGHPLAKPPEHGHAAGAKGNMECDYTTVLAAPGVIPKEYDVTLWAFRDGAVDFAQDQFATGAGMHAMRRQVTGSGAAPASDTSGHPAGPWDIAARSPSPGYEAVKGGALIKVAAFDSAGALALLGAAVQALGPGH